MIDEQISFNLQSTFGTLIIAATMALGSISHAEQTPPAKLVNIVPVSIQMGKPVFNSGISLSVTEDATDPRVELTAAYEIISRSQKPLEAEFSKFIATNIWDLI